MRLSVRSGRKTLCSFVHNSLFLSPPLLHQLNMNVNSQLINQILPQSPPAKHVIDVTAAQKVLQPSSTPFTSSSSHRNALVELIKSPFLISTRSFSSHHHHHQCLQSIRKVFTVTPPLFTFLINAVTSQCSLITTIRLCLISPMIKKTSVDKKIVHTDRLESLS